MADSVRMQRHLYAMDILMQQRFSRLRPDKILVHFLDIVDASILPALAEEFDVLGIKGWDFVTTEKEQRELLKNAIALKRRRGTEWAVEQAINLVYSNYAVDDHFTHWAIFRIRIDSNVEWPDPDKAARALALINEYKPKSRHLKGIYFTGINGDDSITIDETDLVVNYDSAQDDTMSMGNGFFYDGAQNYDGDRNYSQDSDTVTINFFT